MKRNSTTNVFMVYMVFAIFFVISFLTNIIGPILPTATENFHLSLAMAGFLPFAFFIAYGVMSIPAGYGVEKYGEKKLIMFAFSLATASNFIFVIFPSYLMFICSLFLVGCGMAILQVVINPLLRSAGGEKHYSFNSVMAQLIFGLASFISPLVFSFCMRYMSANSVHTGFSKWFIALIPKGLPWVSVYLISAVISLIMVIIIGFISFPEVSRSEEEQMEGHQILKSLIKNKTVLFFFFGILCYTGTEQGFNDWMSKYLQVYYHYDTTTVGAYVVAKFWLLMTIGGIVGLGMLKLMDVKKVLGLFILLTFGSLSVALFGTGHMALVAFPLCGFFLSVMYPGVFSLGLNSLKDHHGTFSGILCSGIVGGAIIPMIMGIVGNIFSLKIAMYLLYFTLFYMLVIAIKSKPFVTNKTLFSKEK